MFLSFIYVGFFGYTMLLRCFKKNAGGWFHGFKPHIVINDKDEILNFTSTQTKGDN